MAHKKASAAQKARLKALRRKHGLGEFSKKKNNPNNKVRRASVTRRSFKMAKKKRSSRRRAVVAGLQKPLVAGVTYAFVQPFLSQFLQRFNIGVQDELVQILIAVVLKNMPRAGPIVNNWANAAIIINTASLTQSLTAGLNLGGLLGTQTEAAPMMVAAEPVVI